MYRLDDQGLLLDEIKRGRFNEFEDKRLEGEFRAYCWVCFVGVWMGVWIDM